MSGYMQSETSGACVKGNWQRPICGKEIANVSVVSSSIVPLGAGLSRSNKSKEAELDDKLRLAAKLMIRSYFDSLR